MKKLYEKPNVVIENFILSESIAGACAEGQVVDKGFWEIMDFLGYFNAGKNTCTEQHFASGDTIEGTGSEYDGYCYHTLTEGQIVFQS